MNARFDHEAPRPLAPILGQDGSTLPRLVAVMKRLLADDGCPWDREQTLLTLRKYLREESCEVIDAIDEGDRTALCEELGDLLLQVVFQAELTRSEGTFAIDDVVEGIVTKMVRRHPHVFGDGSAKTPDEVAQTWQSIKEREKGARRVLAGIPRSLPSLLRAQTIGERVAKVGFDWDRAASSLTKVDEEIGELKEAMAENDRAHMQEELGDSLFALVNLARHLGLDPEAALGATCDKFNQRFSHVEDAVRTHHGGFAEGQKLPLAVLDGYWNDAKRIEKER